MIHDPRLVWGFEIVFHGSDEHFVASKAQDANMVALSDMANVVSLAQALKMLVLERYDESAITMMIRIWFIT